jgi:hypothetical protein
VFHAEDWPLGPRAVMQTEAPMLVQVFESRTTPLG